MALPEEGSSGKHASLLKLHSLMRRQMSDLEVIETINHLFRCSRCYESFRRVRKAYLPKTICAISESVPWKANPPKE